MKRWGRFFHIEAHPTLETRLPGFQLPRQLGDRVLLGVMSSPILLGSSVAVYGLFTDNVPSGVLARLLWDEAVCAVFVLSALTMLWAVATPRFIERALQGAALHTMIVIFAVNLGLIAWMAFMWARP